MEQYGQSVAVEHQPWNECFQHLAGKGDLIHGLRMRPYQLVVPAPELGLLKFRADALAQALGAAAARCRVVVDVRVVMRDGAWIFGGRGGGGWFGHRNYGSFGWSG